jgi:hypothetical protein
MKRTLLPTAAAFCILASRSLASTSTTTAEAVHLAASSLSDPTAQPAAQVIALPLPTTRGNVLNRNSGVYPLYFETNEGQFNTEVKFRLRGPDYDLFLTPTEVVMVLFGTEPSLSTQPGANRRAKVEHISSSAMSEPVLRSLETDDGEDPEGPTERLFGAGGPALMPMILRTRLVGANPSPTFQAEAQQPGKVNYFVGNDPTQWRTNIPTYGRVRLEQVYPGIDLVYYHNHGQLEYDFMVAPGADPNQIALAIEGCHSTDVNERGELIVRAGDHELRWGKPGIFQPSTGLQSAVDGGYRLQPLGLGHDSSATQLVAFHVGAYDSTRPLVIDPALTWGTFLNGSSPNGGYLGYMTLDRNGNAYVTGMTDSSDFPTRNALQTNLVGSLDAFVTKLDPLGQIVYSTYVGPITSYFVGRIAVDSVGSAYIVGGTTSRLFPIVNAVQTNFAGGTGWGDAFVTKLSPEGSALVYSTYLGGSGNDFASAVAVDDQGNAYVAGTTTSANFPTANPLQPLFGGGQWDAFAAKLSPSGATLIYSTYLGGTGDDAIGYLDSGGAAVDEQGSLYLAGYTTSVDFPTKAPFQQNLAGLRNCFLAKLNPAGNDLVFSSYLGGSVRDYVGSVVLGSSGDLYVAGETSSPDFPTTAPLQANLLGSQNAFVARYSPASNTFIFSTYLGGSGRDSAGALGLDNAGNVYIGGIATSPDFPTTTDAFQPIDSEAPNSQIGFLSTLSADGSKLLYSTYFGGSGDDDQVRSLALDPLGNVYLSGNTDSSDFPISNPVLQKRSPGSYSVYLAKFSPVVGSPLLMRIVCSANIVTISWPAVATGYHLEQIDSLASSPVWSPATNAPVIAGDQNVVTLQADSGARFFRLSSAQQ